VAPSGKKDEIERLVNLYGNDVLRLATVIMGSRETADDVFQETFLRVFRSWENFRGDASEKTWITGIAVNICRDMMRNVWKKRVVLSDEMMEVSPDDQAATEIERRMEHNEVMDAIHQLSPDLKETVMLFYYQDFDVKTIAKVLDIPEGTVKSRLFKARTKLHRLLGGEEHGR
jgi:RNA polymerase sigma-70 factor (ECF subfamily)